MKKMTTRELTLAALFVAVTAVLSQIVIPMPLVPFNLAVLAVFLCGSLLPKGAALLSQLCYLLLGAIGVPVYAQFSAGPSVLFGVTGGYLVAYPVMAWLVALLIEKWAGDAFWKRRAALLPLWDGVVRHLYEERIRGSRHGGLYPLHPLRPGQGGGGSLPGTPGAEAGKAGSLNAWCF